MSKNKYRDTFVNKEVPKVEETPAEEIVETADEVEETVSEDTVEPEVKVEEPETVEGIIEGVKTALNIRRKPEVEPNNQIGIVGKGAKIIVVDPKHPVESNGEVWYKVLLNKEPGFAMKKYIQVK